MYSTKDSDHLHFNKQTFVGLTEGLLTNQYEVIKQLGKGAFGSVSLVRRKKDSQTYAMKRIRLIPLSEKEREISLNEIRIIASLSHQNIISYKESFLDESSKTLNIVM